MKKSNIQNTICSYCGVGCGVQVEIDSKKNISVQGNPDYPVNKGMLCSKGKTLNYVAQDTSDRILYPEMRWSRNHPLQRVSWDAAFDRAAAVFKSIIKKHGPDSVGFYVSGQCLTEEYYLVNKIAKGFIGTNNVDTNSRLCMSSAVVGYKKALGSDSVPISYEDIELADCFLIAGANPAWCHPILFRRLEKHKEENPDVKIIVVDPRKTQTCASADLHLQILPEPGFPRCPVKRERFINATFFETPITLWLSPIVHMLINPLALPMYCAAFLISFASMPHNFAASLIEY